MTVKVGDDVLVLVSSTTATRQFSQGIVSADTDSLVALQSLVDGGAARILNAGVKRYIATLTQASTAAPVATVLENGLSAAVVWTRSASGVYLGTLAAAFTAGKTFAIVTDILSVADISIATGAITLTTDGDGKLSGHTLYVEVRQ